MQVSRGSLWSVMVNCAVVARYWWSWRIALTVSNLFNFSGSQLSCLQMVQCSGHLRVLTSSIQDFLPFLSFLPRSPVQLRIAVTLGFMCLWQQWNEIMTMSEQWDAQRLWISYWRKVFLFFPLDLNEKRMWGLSSSHPYSSTRKKRKSQCGGQRGAM